MKLRLVDDNFRIELEWYEQIFAITLNSMMTIPLSHITNVTSKAPDRHGYALRAPGTYIPCLFKAGTFYTSMGRKFWYINQNTPNYLVLTLQDEDFVRIVLTVQDSQEWIQQIVVAGGAVV